MSETVKNATACFAREVPVKFCHIQNAARGALVNSKRVELFSHLSRITTPGRKFIPQIDGLRFVAIVSVIAYHVWQIGLFHLAEAAPAEAKAGGLIASVFSTGHFGVE